MIKLSSNGESSGSNIWVSPGFTFVNGTTNTIQSLTFNHNMGKRPIGYQLMLEGLTSDGNLDANYHRRVGSYFDRSGQGFNGNWSSTLNTAFFWTYPIAAAPVTSYPAYAVLTFN